MKIYYICVIVHIIVAIAECQAQYGNDSDLSEICRTPKDVKSDYRSSNIVFSGVVYSIEYFKLQAALVPDNTDNEEAPIISMQRVFFSTIEIFKGVFNLSVIEVVTAVDRELYGYQFEVGKEYIVYGIYQNRLVHKGPTVPIFVYTDICMGTTIYDKEEALKLRKAAQGLLR